MFTKTFLETLPKIAKKIPIQVISNLFPESFDYRFTLRGEDKYYSRLVYRTLEQALVEIESHYFLTGVEEIIDLKREYSDKISEYAQDFIGDPVGYLTKRSIDPNHEIEIFNTLNPYVQQYLIQEAIDV